MGRIQSIHSFSTVDGPGTRCVIFFQGCPVGCIFCHNPDAWENQGGEEVTVEELLRRLERYRPFLSQPGVTLSGGEPLAQPDFLMALIKVCHTNGWHVALDTSGWGPAEPFERIASLVDLVMISVKHPLNPEKVSQLKTESALTNLRRLTTINVPVWLRYVLIAGLTDDEAALIALGKLAAEQPRLEKIEILPYNSLAENKWNQIGVAYPLMKQLQSPPAVAEAQLQRAERIVWEAYREAKKCSI
jgi:pyruvate formate lyase activating enzyme